MIRPIAFALLAALALPAPTGCARKDGPEVAFLLSTLQEERYQKDVKYFEARANELGLRVITLAADNDNAKQISEVEDVLAQGVKVLVIQPTDSQAASSYVRLAHEHGAKVIAYDRAIVSPDLDYYVSHDSYKVGVLQAKAAIAATNGKGKYVILSGQAGHSVAMEITRGYDETLAPYIARGDIEIVMRQNHSSWSPEQSLRTVEDALTRTGNHVDAILANNSGMARGAVQAVQSAGLQHVFIAGADADAANINFVCQGKQTIEILKDIEPLARTAAEVARDLLHNEAPPAATTMEIAGKQVPVAAVRVEVITPETVKPLLVDTGFLSADELPACKSRLAGDPVKLALALLLVPALAFADEPGTPSPSPPPSPLDPAGAPAVPNPQPASPDPTPVPAVTKTAPDATVQLPAAPQPETTILHNPSTTDSLAPAGGDTGGAVTAPGVELQGVKLELHGYARMPLMTQGTREPYLVDNDYYLSGFAYTRLYEPDWSELHFSASKGDYKVEFGMFASLYSDYAQADVADQLGIAQASVTANNFLDVKHLSVQVGVFWDRYGYIEPYDTYIFGRTHQGGFKLAYELSTGARIQGGLGFHQADLQQNLGLTPIAHVAAVQPVGPVDVGAYVLRTWTRDERQLSPIQDGTMYVAGLDARYKLPHDRGSSYLAFSFYDMTKALYLAPALEVLHSTGGRGITENFLGLDSSDDGTGKMYTLATDNTFKVNRQAAVRLFGMGTWVRSPQVDDMDPLKNKDRRLYFKWGVEPSYLVLPKVRVSARFDRVILDVYDSQNSFRVLSPKVSFPLDGWGELFVQYSHYWYGDKVQLRSGQVPLETMPDSDVFKVQAQAVW